MPADEPDDADEVEPPESVPTPPEPAPECAPVVVCVHGLTRNGRDFDALAAALSDRFRVICPDLPGRGESDWLAFEAWLGK